VQIVAVQSKIERKQFHLMRSLPLLAAL
jgi:hypothetical protein